MSLNESNRDTLVSYTPPKEIVDLSFEMMFKDGLKILDIHIMDAPIKMCDDDRFVKSISEKKSTILRNMKNKLEKMNTK